MRHPLVLTVAAAITAATVGATACATANPQPPPVPPPLPQAGAPCTADLDGALTALPKPPEDTTNAKNLLRCGDGSWQQYRDPYPSPERWLTTGPELVLHGQGMRNPEVKAGSWTATPQSAETRCSAEQVEVIAAGKTSPPQTLTAEPGESLTVPVSDRLFTLRLSGYCLWQREG